MTIECLVWQSYRSDISEDAGQGTEGLRLPVAVGQRVVSASVEVHGVEDHLLRVEIGVRRATVDGEVDNINSFEHVFVYVGQVDGWQTWQGVG